MRTSLIIQDQNGRTFKGQFRQCDALRQGVFEAEARAALRTSYVKQQTKKADPEKSKNNS
jgi:hypothetical protein